MGQQLVAVVGPSRPFQGGIADHTVELATRLHDAGLLAEHAGWGRQFPARFAPPTPLNVSQQRPGSSELNESDDGNITRPRTTRNLHWDRPMSWWRAGSRLGRSATQLVIVVSSPLQLPAIRTLAWAFKSAASSDSPVTFIVHNVLPHEARLWDRMLMRRVLRTADRVITHSPEQRDLAARLGARNVVDAMLPLHPPAGMTPSAHVAGERRLGTVGFFGMVRRYKGVDLLIEAIARTPNIRLIIQGEFWEPIADYEGLAKRLGVSDRVELRPGFATTEQIERLLGEIDALVLPYTSATTSQQPRISFLRGVPVIVTRVGNLSAAVTDGVDGLVVERPDANSLSNALKRCYSRDNWKMLRRHVVPPTSETDWTAYLSQTTSLWPHMQGDVP